MFPRNFIPCLIAMVAAVCACRADVITGVPAGGPVTLHDGNFPVDLNSDGAVDFTIADTPLYAGGSVAVGSWTRVLESTGSGVYRGNTTDQAVALSFGDEVGPALPGDFIYADSGLHPDPSLHYYNVSSGATDGDPRWLDSRHHFVATDLPVGTDHHYGWIEMSLEDSGAPTGGQPWYDTTIYGWAYETQANVPVAIPEPGPVGLLALSAAVGVARRGQPRSRGGTAGINRRITNNGLATGTALRIERSPVPIGRA